MKSRARAVESQKVTPLKTERLILRGLRLSDAKDVFEYASDPEVTKHVRFVTHKSLAETRAFLRASQKRHRAGQTLIWAITLKSTGKMIGTCGLVSIAREHGRAEIGYAINRKFWGQGYAVEATAAIAKHALTALNFNRVEAHVSPDHRPSQRVLEKCGFVLEGTLRQHELIKGRWHDSRIYSILQQECEKT